MSTYSRSKPGIVATFMLVISLMWMPLAMANEGDNTKDKSDLNSDLSVDIEDLKIFSTNYLDTFWENVDWCRFYTDTVAGNEFEGRRTKYYKQHFTLLLAFVNTGMNCGGDPYLLELDNDPKALIRIAESTDDSGDYYITDARVGSLFIYDADLTTLKAEIKGLSKPLGVAVDTLGYILVGNDGRDNVEVYDPATGDRLIAFGEGLVKMPTAITVAPNGEIYVTDSRSHNVRVFDDAYNPVRTIGVPGTGDGGLSFPTDTEIVTTLDGNVEVFVADQGNNRVQVFDNTGNYLRTIDSSLFPELEDPPQPDPWVDNNGDPCPEPCTGWMCGWGPPPPPPPPECNPVARQIEFTKLQALRLDDIGRLHILDISEARVSVLDPADGSFISYYGEYGQGTGYLRLPMDISINEIGQAIVIAGAGDRIELLSTPQ